MIDELATAGFDLVQRFDAIACARELGVDVLSDPARPVGLLVGNTRALWPRFLAARRTDAALAAATDPIERYTEATIARVSGGATALFAHRRYGGAFLPFQRIAVTAGLATLAPTQLLIHPTFGPWFALRAVILTGGELGAPRARAAAPCSCGAACLQAFERARAAGGDDAWRAWLAVRDACPIGREHRYGDAQLAYHYTKDHRHLK